MSESSGAMVIVEKRFWGDLPEHIFILILRALPPPDYCRLRCVCKKWNKLLSSSPDWKCWTRTGAPYLVATSVQQNSNKRNIRTLCHSEERFRRLPFYANLTTKLHFASPRKYCWALDLVDVDEELFCYHVIRPMEKGSYLALCNPLGQAYKVALPEAIGGRGIFVKLLVDRLKQTFRIVLLCSTLPGTWIFYSTTSVWRFQGSCPPFADQFFVWKNELYAYGTFDVPSGIYFFETGSGLWKPVRAALPGGKGPWRIVSNKDQLMLIRNHSGEHSLSSRVSVWKLKEDGSNQGPDFSLPMWENSHIGRRVGMRIRTLGERNASERDLIDICCGTGFICFVFRETLYRRRSAWGTTTYCRQAEVYDDIVVKYSFSTGRINVIPYPPGWTIRKLFAWEPDLKEFKLN